MAATATDASRSSSSGSADSYIGSLISLTSKSEIRYEGLLFNINAEESSIGLRNVRSFGTEGRKKDGLQVPPSDKVYEYILFRGSDIKDLQVKSSPPVQVTTPVYEDPAIIQTHYPQATSPSVSLASSGPATVQSHYPKATNPSVIPSSGPALIQTQYPQAMNPLVSIPSSGSGSVPDLSAQNLHAGFPRPTLQGNLSLYQPIGGLVSWGSSPPIPATNGSAVAPMYWQGYYGPSNGFQSQQQTLFRPPPGLPLPSSFQQMTQQAGMSALFPTGESSMEALKSSESSSALLPPHSTATPNFQSSVFPFQPPSLGMGTLNLQSQMLPTQPSPVFSASSTNLIPNNVSIAAAAASLSFPLVSPLISSLGKPTIQPPISEEPITVPKSKVQMKPLESSSVAGMSSSILNEGARPTLITPGQLLQPGPSAVSSSQPLQTSQKDAEVVKVSSSALLSSQVAIDAQKPILPLPSPADKPQGAYANYQYNYRGGGHQRGRGNRMPRPVTRFTEEFDFIAMNEKFNKDEVWGDLGKSSKAPEDGNESEDEDIAGSSRPVYVKDDFFDELSCDAFDHGSQSSRARFSERLRKDSETFGFIPRQQGGRGGYGSGRGYGPGRGGYGPGRGYGPGQGGYGPGRGGHGYGRGGQSNEAYYGGRGSSYVERDRGHNFPGRGT